MRRLFNETFHNQDIAISKSTVERTIKRFEETGSVKNRAIPDKSATAINLEKSLNVL